MSNLPDGPWSVAEGTYDDRPLIVRINAGAAALKGMPELRHRVDVAVPLKAPRPDGLPDADESAALGEIEDALANALKVGADAVQVLALTTSGMREFVFHTTVPDSVAAAVGDVRTRFPSDEIQFVQADDPNGRSTGSSRSSQALPRSDLTNRYR